MRVEENECKENRKYSWCVFREKNINATWRTGKLGHDDATTPDYSIYSQRRNAWPKPSAPTSTSVAWWAVMIIPLTGGCNSECPPMPAPDQCSTIKMMFLEEEDHQCEERVASLRTRFWKLSSEREDEGDKRNTRMFWKVFLSRRKFQFLTF